MAQIDILKEVLGYSLRKFEHCVIGSKIYFNFNAERYAIAKLKKVENLNEFDGISVTYVSKLFGKIDQCDITFKEVFEDSKRAVVHWEKQTDAYEWFNCSKPSQYDLNLLAQHLERYFTLIGDFGNITLDYTGVAVLATQTAIQSMQVMQEQLGVREKTEDSELTLPLVETSMIDAGEEAQEEPLSKEDEVVVPVSEISDGTDSLEESVASESAEGVDVLQKESTVDATDGKDTVSVSTSLEQESGKDTPEAKEEKTEPFTSDAISSNQVGIVSSTSKEIEHSSIEKEKPLSKEYKKPKFGFHGLFKGTKTKPATQNVVSHTKIESSSVDGEESNEELQKPLNTWNIGKVNAEDLKASLYSIEKRRYYLKITGSGEMRDFKVTPWNRYREEIEEIKMEEGITSIGNKAFVSFGSLKSIVLPNSVTRIGLSAFEYCFQLKDVQWSQNLRVISDFAFSGKNQLKEVYLPDSVEEICDYAFDFSNDFVIACTHPERLRLGVGISISDFKKIEEKTSKISVDDYMV